MPKALEACTMLPNINFLKKYISWLIDIIPKIKEIMQYSFKGPNYIVEMYINKTINIGG